MAVEVEKGKQTLGSASESISRTTNKTILMTRLTSQAKSPVPQKKTSTSNRGSYLAFFTRERTAPLTSAPATLTRETPKNSILTKHSRFLVRQHAQRGIRSTAQNTMYDHSNSNSSNSSSSRGPKTCRPCLWVARYRSCLQPHSRRFKAKLRVHRSPSADSSKRHQLLHSKRREAVGGCSIPKEHGS